MARLLMLHLCRDQNENRGLSQKLEAIHVYGEQSCSVIPPAANQIDPRAYTINENESRHNVIHVLCISVTISAKDRENGTPFDQRSRIVSQIICIYGKWFQR